MAGIGECTVGLLLPEDDEAEEIHRCFTGFREEKCVEYFYLHL